MRVVQLATVAALSVAGAAVWGLSVRNSRRRLLASRRGQQFRMVFDIGVSVLTVVAIALLVASAATVLTSDGEVYRLVGTGYECDDRDCPPGEARYSLQLVPAGEPAANSRSYNLAENAPHRDDVSDYPECMLARIDGGTIESWERAACP